MVEFRFYIEIDGTRTEVIEPKNFKDVTSKLTRDMSSHGVFFEYTSSSLKLGFKCGEGYELLENQYVEYGINAEAYYIVEQLISETWTEIFKGKVDFTERKVDKNFFEATINRVDYTEKIKNRRDLVTQIDNVRSLNGEPIAIGSSINVVSFGRTSEFIADYVINSQLNPVTKNDTFTTTSPVIFAIPFDIESSTLDGAKTSLIATDFEQATGTNGRRFTENIYYAGLPDQFPGLNIQKKFRITGKIRVKFELDDGTQEDIGMYAAVTKKCNLAWPYDASFDFGGGTITNMGTQEDVFFDRRQNISTGEWQTFDIDLEDFIYPNYIYNVGIRVYSLSNTGDFSITFDEDESFLRLREIKDNPPSEFEAYKLYDAINNGTKFITDDDTSLDSPILDTGCIKDYCVFAGYDLRKINDKPFEIEWKNLIQSTQKMFGLGYGIENGKLAIRPYHEFYGEYELMDIGVVSDFEEEPMTDLLANRIKIGYDKFANDEERPNTLNDIHTEQQYATALQTIENEIDLISKVLASSYLIESTREQLFLSESSESFKHDNETFIININNQEETRTYTYRYNVYAVARNESDDPRFDNANTLLIGPTDISKSSNYSERSMADKLVELIKNSDNARVTVKSFEKTPNTPWLPKTSNGINEGTLVPEIGGPWDFERTYDINGYYRYTQDEVESGESDFVVDDGDNFIPETLWIATFRIFLDGDDFPFSPGTRMKYCEFEFDFSYTGIFPKTNEDFSQVNNIFSPETFYNLRLSPKRMLQNNGYLLNSMLGYQTIDTLYRNTQSKVNGDAQHQLKEGATCELGDKDKELLQENNDEAMSSLYSGGRRFVPNILRGKVNLCFEDIEKIRKAYQNQLTGSEEVQNYGYLTLVDFNNNTRTGYIKEFEYNIATGQVDIELIERFSSYNSDDFDPEWFEA